jgi:hypothetical protein
MRFLVKAAVPVEIGNLIFKNPDFCRAVEELLADVKPDQAYLGVENGRRCFFLILELTDSQHIPRVAEPLWQSFNAEVEFVPLMDLGELARAAPIIRSAAAKY